MILCLDHCNSSCGPGLGFLNTFSTRQHCLGEKFRHMPPPDAYNVPPSELLPSIPTPFLTSLKPSQLQWISWDCLNATTFSICPCLCYTAVLTHPSGLHLGHFLLESNMVFTHLHPTQSRPGLRIPRKHTVISITLSCHCFISGLPHQTQRKVREGTMSYLSS